MNTIPGLCSQDNTERMLALSSFTGVTRPNELPPQKNNQCSCLKVHLIYSKISYVLPGMRGQQYTPNQAIVFVFLWPTPKTNQKCRVYSFDLGSSPVFLLLVKYGLPVTIIHSSSFHPLVFHHHCIKFIFLPFNSLPSHYITLLPTIYRIPFYFIQNPLHFFFCHFHLIKSYLITTLINVSYPISSHPISSWTIPLWPLHYSSCHPLLSNPTKSHPLVSHPVLCPYWLISSQGIPIPHLLLSSSPRDKNSGYLYRVEGMCWKRSPVLWPL